MTVAHPIDYVDTMPDNEVALSPGQQVIQPDDTQSIAEALIPHFTDNSLKNKYLSYRATGFTVNEAIQLAGTSYPSVMRWRHHDPRFKELDTSGISDLRDQVGTNYLRMEFSRNMRLILERDRQVIIKAIADSKLLTQEEAGYLRQVRNQYTPQQMQALEMVLAKEHPTGDAQDQWDLRSIVMRSIQNGRDMELTLKLGEEDATNHLG